MKIICDNCRTKYSIADEKVKGKVFKIRCKKCQNIIVVRGNEGAAAESSQGAEDLGAGADAGGGGEAVWHLVIGREQVGPMSPFEVRDRFARGDIDADTYIWREGFADWLRLAAVEDFADVAQATAVASVAAVAPSAKASAAEWQAPAPAAQPAPAAWEAPRQEEWQPRGEDTARADSASLFGGNLADAGKDLFSSQSGHDPASPEFASSGTHEPAAAADLFRPAAAAPASGGDIFGGPVGGNGGQQLFPAEEKPAGGGGVQMTGARHENSVLFSLTNLQALAMGGKPQASSSPSASSGGDGSGLIDIRSMAIAPSAKTGPSSSLDDLPDLGGYAAPIAAAPVLMPTMTDEKPKWILPVVIGVGATLVLSVVALTVVLVLRKPEVQVPLVATNVQPTQLTGAATKPDPTKAEAKADEKKDVKKDVKVADAKEEPKKTGIGRKGKVKGKKKPGGTHVAAADPTPATPAKAGGKTGRPGKKRDDLDALIDGAIGGGGPKKAPKAKTGGGGGGGGGGSDANLPETLSHSQIQGGMRGIKGRVQGCFDKFRVPGMATVGVTISKSGSISGAKVKGIFAGTPTGACIQAAMKSASFPRFRGAAVSFDYPFQLR